MIKKIQLSLIASALMIGGLYTNGFAADEWYENLESSTMKYTHRSDRSLDRRAVSSELVSDINDSRLAQNAWGASSQMMIKPAESG